MADELLRDLPGELPKFVRRFGGDAKCRAYMVRGLWHHFARLIELAVVPQPTNYHAISEGAA